MWHLVPSTAPRQGSSYQQSNYNCCAKFPGVDAAFIGPNETQFAILDEDKNTLSLYMLPGAAVQEPIEKKEMFDENPTAPPEATSELASKIKGPMQFMFESGIDRIFSTPLGVQGVSFSTNVYVVTS